MTVIVEGAFVVNKEPVIVPEDDTASFQVKLSAEPESAIIATVDKVSGDSDISVLSGSILTFNSMNWDSYKTVTLKAAEDPDKKDGNAIIGIRAEGIVDKNITAKEYDNDNISGIWRIDPISQYEQCRYTGHDWWPEYDASSFNIKISQPGSQESDDIKATYVTNTDLVLTGTWDSDSGEFNLFVDTSATEECGYLFYGSDICGDAIDCTLVSCRNKIDISGSTLEKVETLEAESTWYYSVTFSYYRGPGLPPGQTTWECQGSATQEGERQSRFAY
jgi:hypothetical protein